MKFIAIMGFIGCGLAVLDAVFTFFGFAFLPGSKTYQALPGGFLMLSALFYVAVAVFGYFLPSLLLIRSASVLDRIETKGTLAILAEASERQRRFWKYCGILMIVGICIFILFVIGAAIIIPILAAHMHQGHLS